MTTSAHHDEGGAQKGAPRPGRWRRRLLWLVGFVLLGRVLLGLGLEPTLRIGLAAAGLQGDWDSVQLDLLDGRLELRGLTLRPKLGARPEVAEEAEGTAPMVSAATLAVDVDAGALLHGRLRVERLELLGSRIHLDRGVTGGWNFAPLAGSGGSDEAAPPSESGPLLFDLPFELLEARVQDLGLSVRDLQAVPSVDVSSRTSLTLTNVGVEGELIGLDLRMVSSQCLDLLRVNGGGRIASKGADLTLELTVAGLRAEPLLGLLSAAGLDARAESLQAGARLRLEATPVELDPARVQAVVIMDQASVRADATEALGLEALEVRVDRLGGGVLEVASVLVDGLVAEAVLETDGTFTFAGFGPSAAADTAAAGTAAAGTETAATPSSPSPSVAGAGEREAMDGATPTPLRWSLASAVVKEGRLSFTDRAMSLGHRITAHLDRVEAGPISSMAGAPPSDVRLLAEIPGVAGRIVVDGTIDSVGPRFQGSGEVKIEHLVPDELAPYLALAGMAPAFDDGTFEVDKIDADGLTFALRGLRVRDSGEELAAIDMARVAVGGEDRFEVEVSGARGRVRRRLDDSIEGLGLRFNIAADAPERVADADGPPVTKAEAPATPFVVPKVWLPHLDLQFERLELISEQSEGAPVSLGPITLKAGRAEGSAPGAEAFAVTARGKVRVARDFSASVQVDSSEEGFLSVQGETSATGVNLDPVREWVQLLGVDPLLEDGALEARFDLGLRAVGGRPDVSLTVGRARLEERTGAEVKEWLDVKELRVDGLRPGGESTLAIESLSIVEPRVRLERDAAGAWSALGMRALAPKAGSDAPAKSGAKGDQGARPSARSGWLTLGDAGLGEATITLVDGADAGAPPLVLGTSLSLKGFAPGVGAPPAAVSAQLVLEGAEWDVTGSVQPDPAAAALDVAVTMEHLNGGALARLLPSRVDLRMTDGVARARVRGARSQPEDGGTALAVEVEDLDLRERGAEQPVLGASLLRLTAPRIDLGAGVVDVDDITVEALALDLVRLANGGVRVAGVELHPAPADEAESEAPEPSPRRRLRSVRLGALDLGLDAVSLSTEGADGAPFVGTSRIKLKDSVEFDAEDFLDDAPPIELEITGRAAPGEMRFTADLSATPFEPEPEIDGRIQIDGIDGAFFHSILPAQQTAEGEAVFSQGSFAGEVESQFRWRRNGPLDFDLRSGFGLGLELNDLALRHTAGGPVVLGLDRLSLDASTIAPRAGRYQFRRVEIEKPRAVMRRVDGGLEVAGLLVLPDQAEAPETLEAPEGATVDLAVAGEEGAARAVPAARHEAVVTVDDLLLRDLDVLFEDQTVSPVLSVPLVALDAEVRGLSSRMLREPRPVRFSLSLGGGNVSLPVRLKRTSLIRGVAEGVAGAVSSREAEAVTYEERPLFRELVTSGQLAFYPSTSGWLQASLLGFELTAFRGLAIAAGIEIGDGVLDLNSRSRLSGTRGGHVDSTISLSHLSLSEPDGGPISRFLKLPAPLDSVIYVLKNEQGEVRLPLSFDFGSKSSMSTAEFSAKASAAFLRLVTEALAAAPLRAVGSVTDVVGLGGLVGGRDRTPKFAGMEAHLDFEVGSAYIDRDLSQPLMKIVKAMAEDPLLELEAAHEFGGEDIERARALANPDSDVAVKLLRSLRRERDVLLRRRGELAAAARSHLQLGRDRAFDETRLSLVQVSRDLGELEVRVDQLAELLGRSAAGRVERRLKRVALDIAQSRMDALMRALIRAGVDQRRVNLKRPRYEEPGAEGQVRLSRIRLQTRAGTPPKGFFSRVLGIFSF